ncbi:MAG: beta-ketoacyl-ACP reductase [Syntrophaceae bacterium]|nr:beta-ketoacyl-ACP reductase [Syntrophaceae bacterium]
MQITFDLNLNGKTAVVTGASRGLGRHIAVSLANYGAFVIVNYKGSESMAKATLEMILSSGGQGMIRKFDVASAQEVETSISEIISERGSVEILVNNAGLARDGLLGRMKISDWNDVIATNLTGTFNTCRYLSKSMIRNRSGRIVNICSVAGEVGNGGQVNYSASKAGIIGFTKALARELAPRNILVNCVSPGLIKGGMGDLLTEKQAEAIVQHVPLGRLGDARDVCAAVVFLCSEMANYITGQVIRVNGGLYM